VADLLESAAEDVLQAAVVLVRGAELREEILPGDNACGLCGVAPIEHKLGEIPGLGCAVEAAHEVEGCGDCVALEVLPEAGINLKPIALVRLVAEVRVAELVEVEASARH
jgi:hypothetical protein